MNEQISNLFSSSTLRSGTLLRNPSISFSVKTQSFGTAGFSTSISSFMDIIFFLVSQIQTKKKLNELIYVWMMVMKKVKDSLLLVMLRDVVVCLCAGLILFFSFLFSSYSFLFLFFSGSIF